MSSSSGSGASKNRSVVTDNIGAVVKLSWVSVVSGVRRSGSVVGSLHSRSWLNVSNLDVCTVGSSVVL
jgi:hypothetical protein